MTEYDNTNRGALFKNDRKETANHPDYTGSINVGGHDFWVSAWIKDGRNGKFMSLSVKPKETRRDQAPPPRRDASQRDPISSGRQQRDDMDDSIPF